MASLKFIPTGDYARSLLEEICRGDLQPILKASSPDMKWILASEICNPGEMAGSYTREEWLEDLVKPLFSRLKDQKIKMDFLSVDVIGEKVILECASEATQLNGRPYNNRYIMIFVFSEDTGKLIEVREYCDTALVKTVTETNN